MKMFKPLTALFVVALLIANATTLSAQNNVGIGTTTPNASAALEVQSTTQGMLVPRMTSAQRTAIATPATGLLVYQTDGTAGFYFYNGSSWLSLNSNTAAQDLNMGNNSITNANTVTANKLVTTEFAVGGQNLISLSVLNATSAQIDATGKTFIFLNSAISSSSHVLCGIAGGYPGKILYVGMAAGFTWAQASSAETTAANQLTSVYFQQWTSIQSQGSHIIKLIYINNKWTVIDQDI